MNYEKEHAIGAGLLRICGIIELVFSGILILTFCLDVAFSGNILDIIRDLILIASFIYSGLIAELNWKKPDSYKRCMVAGLILSAAEIINAICLIISNVFGIFSIIIFILPVVYLVGCSQLKELKKS